MIHTTISSGRRVYVVGDFEDAGDAFTEADLVAKRKGLRPGYRKHFENVPDEEEYFKF